MREPAPSAVASFSSTVSRPVRAMGSSSGGSYPL